MSSPLVAPPVAKVAALFCPNCGGPIELRGFGRALTAVCPQCLSVLDTSTPLVKILGQSQEEQRRNPLIPLGTRGKFAGAPWDVIGFQIRSVHDSDGSYSWNEYLLFNPYKGFRYLTEYHGHWNFVTPMEAMPVRRALGNRPAVTMDGRVFKHFSGCEAATSFVLGEFPWRVQVGERVVCDDFVDPPTILSSETTKDEVTWSRGDYTAGADIWKAFALPGSPPPTRGVYLNQPSPYHGKIGGVWAACGWMLLILIGLSIFFAAFSQNREVFKHSYQFSTADKGEPSYVTPVFDLTGRTASLDLDIYTNLANNWVYFNFALINEDNGHAFDFGREVSYYTGVDSDGSWTEGSPGANVLIPSVPPGHYYLRVEPEMETNANARFSRVAQPNSVYYTLTLRHDVPSYSFFWIAALLLLIPPIVHTARSRGFELKRWMESDYPPVRSGGGD